MRTALLVVAAAICSSCGSQNGTPFDLNGDGTSDGYQYDLDGDGKLDAVDLNGDGIYEGGDYDEDGKVTIFTDQGRGYSEPTSTQLAGFSPDVDPDFEQALDPGSNAPIDVTTQPSVDLAPKLTSVLNQGQLGSCAAFANTVVGSLARSRVEGSEALISAAFLYERQLALSQTACKDGTYIHTGLETLMKEGAPLASELPYSDQVCTTGSSPGANGARSRIGGYSKLEPFNRARVKEVLSSGVPIPFGCSLPPNFMTWAGASAQGVFKSNDGQAGGPHGGGHAMVIIGYDDSRGAYKIQNSWGTDWGDRGYLWWDYADLESRSGLHALIPQLLPNGMNVDPNPMPSTLMISITGAAQFSADTGAQLALRLKATGSFKLTAVSVPSLSLQSTYAQEIVYADVVLPIDQFITAGTYDATIAGELGATSVSQTVSFTVADAVVDPS